MRPDLIVKLGGSHAGSSLLRPWMRAIAGSEAAVVLVPGGGPFADAVRAAQKTMGLDDTAAHDMALLGMAQFGRALASLEERAVLAASLAETAAALRAGRVAVWSPWPELRDTPDIPQTWDVTSDSLALWLARKLGASRLLVVKHVMAAKPVRCDALVRDGILDPAFPRLLRGFDGGVWIAGPDDLPASGLDPHAPPGTMLAA